MTARLLASVLPALALGASCGGRQQAPKAVVVEQDCRGGKAWHQDDAQRFLGCRIIEGTLELGGALMSTTDLAALVQVRGDLVIGPSYQLNNLADLSSLQRIEGSLLVRNNMLLRGLFVGALEEVTGDLRVSGNSSLLSVSLHKLETIGGVLDLRRDNRALELVDLRGLRSLSGVPLQIDWQKALPDAVQRAPVY